MITSGSTEHVTHPDGDRGGPVELVELRLPAQSKYLRLARLTAAGFAGDLNFDVQSLEDLRIAVDELCAAVIDGAPNDAVLVLTYERDGVGVRVQGRLIGRGLGQPDLHPVARELLGMMADAYDVSPSPDGREFWLTKAPKPLGA
jgi:serine/threonine-protein kinase RsbW